VGSGTLLLSTVNSYSGGTVISNGVLQVGVANAVPSTGAGDVSILAAGTLDLNGQSDIINGLNGSGIIDTVAGGSPTLTIGNNNDNGAFSGVIQNSTGGTLAITKAGNGTELLTATNTYSGPTTINAGTIKLGNAAALTTNANVTINSGQLDVNGYNTTIVTLAGAGNIINSGSGSNTLSIISAAANTFNGAILDNGVAAGELSVFASGGSTVRLNGFNTYSGGTFVDTNTTLATGGGGAQLGTAGIYAANGATIAMPNTGSGTPTIGNNITTAPGASVSFTSGTTANAMGGSFIGSANSTNVFYGNMSIGGTYNFSNFLGTVIFATTVNGTRFSQNAGVVCGGDQTTFSFQGGGIFTRNAATLDLGAINGGSGTVGITGPSVTPGATLWIGNKGVDSAFEGVISGSNYLVKAGSGRLTLDGALVTTNTDSATYTNYLISSSIITYLDNTTISNGVLALVAPNTLTNSPVITLTSPTSVLDASAMGYVSNELSVDDGVTPTNSVLVTNALFELTSTQSLYGIGAIFGTLHADSGSLVSVGQPLGQLLVTNNVDIEGTLDLSINRTNTSAQGVNSKLAATGTIVINGAIVVTNQGFDLVTGDVYHLFNHAISGAYTLSLPVQNAAATITYQYQTNLATDGSIKVLVGAAPAVNPNPTNLIASVSGNVLSLSWPADHTGWRLLVQTNHLANGLSANTNDWTTVTGSSSVDATNITINPALPTEFYRLVYP
jgi:autotransporter-associated beta strand protein